MSDIISGGSIGGELPFGSEPPSVAQLGRIGGKLLNANLIRNGVDLAFENDLLYLDVNNQRIGINKIPTTYALEVDSLIRTNEFSTDNSITVGDISLNIDNSITTLVNPIELFSASGVIFHDSLATETLIFDDNRITTVTNGDITLDPSGTGRVDFLSNVEMTGDLSILGNINLSGDLRVDGNIIIGDTAVDIATISADFTEDLIPATNDSFDLGTSLLRWDSIRLTNADLDTSISVPNFTISTNPNTISVDSGDITFVFPSDEPTVTVDKLKIGTGLTIEGNVIAGGESFTDLSTILIDTIETPDTVADYFSGFDYFPELYGHGNTIEIQEPYLIVGASGRSSTTSSKVFVFDLSTRTLLYQIDNPQTSSVFRGFGGVIRANSQYIVVGCSGTSSSSQSITVFNIADGSLVRYISTPAFNQGLGAAQILLTEDRIIASEGRNRFRVQVFDFSGTLIDTIIPPPISIGFGGLYPFGHDMAINSELLFITSPRAVNANGLVYVYNLSNFSLLQTISNPDAGTVQNFGLSILVTDQYLIVSSNLRVYIFSVVDYSLIRSINPNISVPAGLISSDSFGRSLTLKENILAVGAPGTDELGTNAGVVYLFDIDTGSLLKTITNPGYDGNTTDERFGQHVVFYEDLLFVANPDDAQKGVLHAFEIGKSIRFTPNGTGEINLESTSNIIGNLSTTQNFTLAGSLQANGSVILGDNSSDIVRIRGQIINSLIPDADLAYDIGESDKIWNELFVDNTIAASESTVSNLTISPLTNTIFATSGNITFDFLNNNAFVILDDLTIKNNLKIQGNVIETQNLNDDILFNPNGTGIINLQSTTNIQNNLNSVTDVNVVDLQVDGNTTFGNDSSDITEVRSKIINSLIPLTDSMYDLGTTDKSWRTIYLTDVVVSSVLVGNISISSGPDTISTNSGNLSFLFPEGNSETIVDNIIVDDNLKLQGNLISTKNLDSDVILSPNGTGVIRLEADTNVSGDFQVSGNTNLNGNLTAVSNLIIGDQITDTVSITPDLTLSILPGIDGVFDLGRAADDSSPRYWGTAYISETSNIGELLTNSIVISEQTSLNGNTATISTIQSNDDLILNADSDTYYIDSEIQIGSTGGVITNLNTTTPVTLTATGRGYYKFDGTNALLLPAGDDAARPSSPEIGDARWNTEQDYLEIYDGTVYRSSAGETGDLTAQDVEDVSFLYTIVFG